MTTLMSGRTVVTDQCSFDMPAIAVIAVMAVVAVVETTETIPTIDVQQQQPHVDGMGGHGTWVP
jgi:hypothetical protein